MGLLTPLTLSSDELPVIVVHGTRHQYWHAIVASGGLKPMARNHVHFATGVPEGLQRSLAHQSTATSPPEKEVLDHQQSVQVTSGMRNTSTILMFLDIRRALQQGGLVFGMSVNGVVLTEGDKDAGGLVSLQYFSRVEEARTGKLLVEHGKVVAEPTPLLRGGGKHGGGIIAQT